MANDFNKEERVAFEELLSGFEDALVLSRNVSIYRTDQQMMERAGDTIWRPQPYIMESFDGSAGTDISSNFKDATQLSVPASIDTTKTSAWTMNAEELRESLREGRLGEAAKQKLASDINVAMMLVAAQQGTLVVKRTAAASGYDDVAECEAVMNEQGIMSYDRFLALSTRDYNGMASNLASRATMTGKPEKAYEDSYVGKVASFETYKLDYANRLAVALGTTVTVNGADQYHTPKGIDLTQSGQKNVDNRTQEIILAVTSGAIAVGDCFTIVGVNAVHHITKEDTGQLKTFRITSLLASSGASGTMQISPAIVSDGGSTDAEAMYKNVTATPANGAALVFLNTVAANVNPFWHKDALEILPGRLVIEEVAGVSVMHGATEQGLELSMSKQWDINTNKMKYRVDTLFGVVNKQPEMTGIMLFSQT